MSTASQVIVQSEYSIVNADCRELLGRMRPECVDAFVQDPPYGLAFMGKGWDHAVPGPEYFAAQLRVAKPGAHLVAFGGTRTYHRLTCAIEDAGWELRDCLMWLYGSGFPKSHDIPKGADDLAFGAWLDTHGHRTEYRRQLADAKARKVPADEVKALRLAWYEAAGAIDTDAAQRWEGWGTALKPAWEPIILARKPFKVTVATNVLEHGTGALNIDGCRINPGVLVPGGGNGEAHNGGRYGAGATHGMRDIVQPHTAGRWPANVVLDPEAGAILDAQTGELKAGVAVKRNKGTAASPLFQGGLHGTGASADVGYGGTGGASRFFYCAKASKSEREAGLEDFTPQIVNDGRETSIDNAYQRGDTKRRNTHPTVKPLALMRWLVRLVTPPGGLVCDPFCGSGSTGCAAVAENFNFLGIDREPEFVRLADARVAHWVVDND